MTKLSILVAQEYKPYRQMLVQAAENSGLCKVELTASTGMIALERLKQRLIDVVLLSQYITEADCLETLTAIRNSYPHIQVILVSDTRRPDSTFLARAKTLGCQELLMIDPQNSFEQNVASLKARLQGLFTLFITSKYACPLKPVSAVLPDESGQEKTFFPRQTAQLQPRETSWQREKGLDLVLIAASTGGPAALRTLCHGLSGKIEAPILIVQHMPAEFTGKLAESLNKTCALPVSEAADQASVIPGEVLLAPGSKHMALGKEKERIFVSLEDGPPVHGVKPSADVLFSSAADICSAKQVLAVVLTGMGSDGLLGVSALKKMCYCYCLAQSENTCVVYGMPGSIVQAGLADEVVDINQIPGLINYLAASKRRK